MKRVLIFLLLQIGAGKMFGQNLIPNPGFKNYQSCPIGLGHFNGYVKDWRAATPSTPDYFSHCHDALPGATHYVGVPNNAWGIQASHDSAYVGLGTIYGTSEDRDYVTARIPALIPGAVYLVSMRISLADNSIWATYAPAFFFSVGTDSFSLTHSRLPYSPQISFDGAGHITDKGNWVILSDTLIADSAYTRLTIGSFRDNANTTKTDKPDGVINPMMMAYYYIDSVTVEKIANSSGFNDVGKSEALSISPNPSNGSFTIALRGAEEAQVVVTDLAGRVVKELSASGKTDVKLDAPAGVYIVTAYLDSGVLRQKIVVR